MSRTKKYNTIEEYKQSAAYHNKIERQKAVSKFATKVGLSLKDARIYFRAGLTPSEAKTINNMVEIQNFRIKTKEKRAIVEKIKDETKKGGYAYKVKGHKEQKLSISSIEEIYEFKIKSKDKTNLKQITKEAMADYLKTAKGTKMTKREIKAMSKETFKHFQTSSTWNSNLSAEQASFNNIRSVIKEAGQWRQFTGQMLAHRGYREEWDPRHIEYNGGGSDKNGQFTKYTYTSFKNGKPYRQAIIKIYNSKSDVKIEYKDL